MVNDPALRQQSLEVLKDYKRRNRSEMLKAVFDLRHNAKNGDEAILFPLLEHPDDGVVASTLYSLFEIYGQQVELEPMIRRLAWGDNRDCGEMPIQSMAISLLSKIGRSDYIAQEQLKQIAEDVSASDVPRKLAWQCLAELHGVEWLPQYSEEMIMSPESDESERIRESIRRTM
jgi:hypothetical protein